jgi:hypothetical protein
MRRAACLVLSLTVCGTASAQSNPRQLADANKSAMEQYNNLDIDAAKATLDKSIKNAEKNGIRGPALARTYSNLAVVLVGGLGDKPGATTAFQKALSEDPTVEPDPIVATPEVMQAFNAAKRSAPAAAVAEEDVPAPRKRSSEPASGNLEHTPVAEQLKQTAVPVFVAKSDLEIDKIKIAYRSTGMSKPRSAAMTETEDGYTFLIPCADVFEPEVEYFIVAVDGDGNEVGRFGTADAPVAVPIVASRTGEAPSLPGEAPPTQCASSDDECPPGMPGCESGGNAGLGESCSEDSDCGSGMVCEDDYCSMGDRDDEQEERSSSRGKGGKKKFYVDLGIGVAMTAVGEGRNADRKISEETLTEVARDATMNGMISRESAIQLLAARGWDCDPLVTDVLTTRNCAVAVNPGGIVPVPVINFAAGYFVTPKLALALTGRFQLGRGEGPMAGITVGGRGEYYLTQPSDKGLKFALVGGASVGQIQARPPAEGSRQGPFATNANVDGVGFILNAGARAAYMFTPNLGINITPIMNFGLPNFLFSLDLVAGVSTAF